MDTSIDLVCLSGALRLRVLQRLGFSSVPPPNLESLRAVYRNWCVNVPFDNIRKMIALRSPNQLPLPGGHAEEFFEDWLEDGSGGTCWPTSNALFVLLRSVGFNAFRITGYMRDLGIVNHASVKVKIEDSEWLVDSSTLTNEPLPLRAGTFIHDDPVFSVEVEHVDSSHIIWADSPPNPTHLPCRLRVEPVDHAYYVAGYERSRERSPFNQRLYARRNRPGEMLILYGNTRFSKTTSGLESRDLGPDELCLSLREEIGISERLIRRWTESGALEASLEPSSGPKPPPILQKPPSKR